LDNIINNKLCNQLNSIKKYDTHLAKLGDVEYKGYTVGDLPPSFGFIYDKATEKDGKHQWFKLQKV